MRNKFRWVGSLIALTFFTFINGCDNAYNQPITQGEFAGIKIGQSKREVLKGLALYGIDNVMPYYKDRVKVNFDNINRLHEVNEEKGICLTDGERLSLKLEFNDSGILIHMDSSETMKSIKHGIATGQPKSEVLRSLGTMIKSDRALWIRNCIYDLHWVDTKKFTEGEVLYLGKHDLWRYHATDSYSYTDLYFSENSLIKIIYHYRKTEFSFLD